MTSRLRRVELLGAALVAVIGLALAVGRAEREG
jgi:hypothetical protein